MKTYNKIQELQNELQAQRNQGKTIGFVPTMGALHQGHISLVHQARAACDIVVVSIFVNPIQFNNPEDLKKYPRTYEADAKLLEEATCDYIFYPTVGEMYPEKVTKKYDFGNLETVMEGAFREGHFNGVGVVVNKLFEIVNADKAFFGKKDFQQLAIIRSLVEIENLSVEIIAGETMRECDGLAMSSRNVRLTEEERTFAPEIFSTLNWVKENMENHSPIELMEVAMKRLSVHFKPEYFQIVDGLSLQMINSWDETNYPVACVAAHLGQVRLIDNIELNR
ncbi:pantoate--beta-alanine ligase [Lentimicrobium sp. S6]|uniref:pantoate--beta-alanine ligase n=1 Tax=Lentimicrobium sp. S6 TaxID=2735872 RepID=UPI001556F705|nr:pantoate--beta-alanine ligase [Lentimicrobium sp. S6]NPD47844.1 pantoate--beta-alanine ligase [Lentimicrobium sp. S6]